MSVLVDKNTRLLVQGPGKYGMIHLDGCKAYLAGPPVMVEAASKLFERLGMRRIDVHADAFYTAAEMANAGLKTGAEL